MTFTLCFCSVMENEFFAHFRRTVYIYRCALSAHDLIPSPAFDSSSNILPVLLKIFCHLQKFDYFSYAFTFKENNIEKQNISLVEMLSCNDS